MAARLSDEYSVGLYRGTIGTASNHGSPKASIW